MLGKINLSSCEEGEPNGYRIYFKEGDYTFKVPEGVDTLYISASGGGGGGGGGGASGSYTCSGAGGGSGYIEKDKSVNVTPGDVLDVHIGQGGSGGTGTTRYWTGGKGSSGYSGGATYIICGEINLVNVAGGQPGEGGTGGEYSTNTQAQGGTGGSNGQNGTMGSDEKNGGAGGIPNFSTYYAPYPRTISYYCIAGCGGAGGRSNISAGSTGILQNGTKGLPGYALICWGSYRYANIFP